jgi:hypothetical protein
MILRIMFYEYGDVEEESKHTARGGEEKNSQPPPGIEH